MVTWKFSSFSFRNRKPIEGKLKVKASEFFWDHFLRTREADNIENGQEVSKLVSKFDIKSRYKFLY
jgi:hypothetical protein